MKTRELILTHSNTDFDAFAAMVAAHKLYPEATICLSGAVNRNVREFHNLHADEIPAIDAAQVELRHVRRVILVETVHPNRLGELGALCYRKGVEVVVFDHHRPGAELPDFVQLNNFITSEDGSLVTLMLRIIAERGVPVTPLEATVFALGIHEDTGSLSFATATVRDAEALAFCMRQGASPTLIERYLHNPLTGPQRDLLQHVLERVEPERVAGLDVLVAAVRQLEYVEGVSVVAHKVMDLTNCDAFFLLVEMEKRIFVTARSRGEGLNVAEVLKPLGGGGHAPAASAILRDLTLRQARTRLRVSLREAAKSARTAAGVMSRPLHWVTTESTIDDALVTCQRYGYGGLSVIDGDLLVGSVSRRDLDRAVSHRLGHAPVKAVMTTEAPVAHAGTPLEELTKLMARDPLGRIPVVADGVDQRPVHVGDVVGVVTRSDLVRAFHRRAEADATRATRNVSDRLAALGLDDYFALVQAVATGYRGVYLVGGIVRDLLLEERNLDIDIAVEGDGIEFARELATRLRGRVRPHRKFQTAVVVARRPDGETFRVDVASTRTEFYDFPAALPKVEHTTIRNDLARRDFTINAMAVSLKPEDFGTLLDYFGGLQDLEEKRIRVLHNLSFIEDPTRIFRAIRYESRYGLRMDRHTLGLAKSCTEMDLVGDLSSARLRDELTLLLSEPRVNHALGQLRELGVGPAIHPRLALGNDTLALVRAGDAAWKRHKLTGEVPLWRLRLVWLLRHLEPEEIGRWAARMRFRRADQEVLMRAHLVGARLADRVPRKVTPAEQYEAVRDEPLEAVAVGIVLGAGTAVEERLAQYLKTSRRVKLAVNGDDLIALGFRESAHLGEVVRTLLHLKLDGVVAGREAELEAARRLLDGDDRP